MNIHIYIYRIHIYICIYIYIYTYTYLCIDLYRPRTDFAVSGRWAAASAASRLSAMTRAAVTAPGVSLR